ncbi:hypothetical protein M378DRAFT_28251 [Amanita muscaria Koide BX008]|uniref:Uncharacterized protein n=1 Tax=Amanita muscaria (strain Koide BX008) TaxID=946122 RepID=A0A0C2W668_AMAMK|nr:hypothetical protein M378DRAFT_28251 [Amanita muscaria Koide BX008]
MPKAPGQFHATSSGKGIIASDCGPPMSKSPAIVRSGKILLRGGSDYQQSFQAMRHLGGKSGRPIRVFGSETLALGVQAKNDEQDLKSVQVDTPLARVTAAEQPPENAIAGAINNNGERFQPGERTI